MNYTIYRIFAVGKHWKVTICNNPVTKVCKNRPNIQFSTLKCKSRQPQYVVTQLDFGGLTNAPFIHFAQIHLYFPFDSLFISAIIGTVLRQYSIERNKFHCIFRISGLPRKEDIRWRTDLVQVNDLLSLSCQ